MNKKINVGVVGYRDFNDYKTIKTVLDEFHEKNNIDAIVSGGAKGVDTLAEKWADEQKIQKIIYRPDPKLGMRGYAVRNQQIVDASTHIFAFPSRKGKGTQMTINMAKKKPDIELKIQYID